MNLPKTTIEINRQVEAGIHELSGNDIYKVCFCLLDNWEKSKYKNITAYSAKKNYKECISALKQALFSLAGQFTHYFIIDRDGFMSCISRIRVLTELDIQIYGTLEDNKISVSYFNQFLRIVMREIYSTKGYIYSDEGIITRQGELFTLYNELRELVTLNLETSEDVTNMKTYLILRKAYAYAQYLYLNHILQERRKNSLFGTNIPYKELYEKMNETVKGKTGLYMKQLIQTYRSEAVGDYIESLYIQK